MGYFDNEKNVQQYIDMVEGYDGKVLIDVLKTYLPEGSTVLELGMGPGKDLDILRQSYIVTGSDNSQLLLDLYKKNHHGTDVLLLDAKTIETMRTFDGIYSNKVLHHLTKSELQESFRRQKKVLKDAGVLFHSFWYGTKQEEHHGLLFVYYTEAELRDMIGEAFEILDIQRYTEMEDNDSLYVALKKQ